MLHKKRLTMKHCFAKAPQYEASPFHSDMKHFAYAPYDLSSIALCATDDEKIKKWEFIRLQYNAIRTILWPAIQSFMAGFFLCLDFTHRTASIYSNTIAPTENKKRWQSKVYIASGNSHFSFSHHPSHKVLWMTGHTERKRSASYRNEMEMLHIVEL